MHVVDAHTHIFSDEMIRRRSRLCETERWFGLLYSNPKARMSAAEELVESMREAKIDHTVACAFPWNDEGLCREHNAYLAEIGRRYSRKISWLGIVAPRPGSDPISEIADIFADGAVGLGELNADAQNFDLNNGKSIDEVAVACVEHGKPLLLHASEPLGHSYPGKGTATPDKLVRFLERNPEVRLVAAHWGGGLPFYELMPEVKVIVRNVVYDTAASTYLYDFRIFRVVLDIVGPRRLLFASDFPLLDQGTFQKKCETVEWASIDEQEHVMGLNAAFAFSIDLEALKAP
jgi:predicted TIM-barrel fold metal-dependent hydrolase